jgi:hypothetical protein
MKFGFTACLSSLKKEVGIQQPAQKNFFDFYSDFWILDSDFWFLCFCESHITA